MRPSKARFVTACQQSLALGAVLAVLAPAAGVISLDVVTQPAETQDGTPLRIAERPAIDGLPAPGPARTEAAPDPAPDPVPGAGTRTGPAPTAAVETEPVEPEVTEAPMRSAGEAVVSDPEPVEGYGAVGVTWSPDADVEEEDITLRVRTRQGGEWSAWDELEYHDEHAPDPDSPEAAGIRPGTDPLLVGEVDEVQAEAVTADGVPAPVDMRLAVVAPGDGEGLEVEPAEIDTAALGPDGEATDEATDEGSTLATSDGEIALQAGATTPKPKIFSRAQWGANENLRRGAPSYYEVHAGFVHHTVNANGYSRSQVPGIIRGIYAYHTQSRGWSDVGYNFLVDRFGRIWEGRAGGVGRPVVGAHTAGYNSHAFAMSAIGNFETAQPPAAMLDAYGRLMAWKLSLHGVDATDSSQRVGSRSFPAINGHRDAGSTACPGRHLYARLGKIRTLADGYQAAWSGRARTTDVVGQAYPDLLLRRKSDQKAFVLPTGGWLRFRAPRSAGEGWGGYRNVVAGPDLTGDGRGDVLVRLKDGRSAVRPGNGSGGFGRTLTMTRSFNKLDQITAVGDLNGDRRNDLVARNPGNGRLLLFRGRGNGTFKSRVVLSRGWGGYNLTAATGDFDGDGRADVLSRGGDRLWLHRGTGTARLQAPVAVNGRHWADWDVITGFGDYDRDGRRDLLVRSRSTQKAFVYAGRANGKVGNQRIGPFGRAAGLARVSGAQVADNGAPDIVGVKGDRLMVVRHYGTRHVAPPVPLGDAFSGADLLLNAGDWDRDGRGDIISRVGGTLRLHRGLGGNKVAAPVGLGSGWRNVRLLEAVGDVTGDGFPDLMGQPANGSMRIYPGAGTRGFTASYVARSAISGSNQLGLGRWDGDGSPDNAFRAGNRLVWYRGNGPGGLTGSRLSLSSPDLTGYDWVISAGDVDRNGRQDLVARKGAKFWLLPGTKKGFATPRFLAGGAKAYDLGG